MYRAVDALCITVGAHSRTIHKCRSEAICMHTPLWSKVISQISHREISAEAIKKPATEVTGLLIIDYLSATTATETFAITL